METKAVILVGHGSRRDEANDALIGLCKLVEKKRPASLITHAFLQFAKPSLEEAIENLAGQGIIEVTIVPVFLYEGIHIREDIPEILASEADKHPDMRLILAPVLGIDERMAEIVLDRVDAAPQE